MKEGGIRTEFLSSALENKIDSRSSVLVMVMPLKKVHLALNVDTNCRFRL